MRVQTEIGLLPEDWKVVRLEDVGSFSKGAGISRSEASSGRIPAVRYGEIYTDHDNYIKRFRSFISSEIAKQSRRMKKGCLLFAASGETKEDIGKAVAFIDDFEAYAGGDLIILNPKGDIVSLYLGYTLNSPVTVRQRAMQAQGDSVVHITTGAIQNIAIPLPPKPEQERIAAALTSIDSLIDNLERTIQKKKHIREGAMEELLSGKRRLPGFSGEWVEKKFEELYKFAKEGGTPSTSNPEFYNNASIPFAKIEDLNNHYLTKTENFINQNGIDHSSAWLVPTGSLLLSNGATLGEVTITAVPLATKQGILGVIVREQFSVEFLYYLLKTKDFKRKMEAITTHGTMDCAYLKDLKGIELYLPSDIHEQHAIADTLTALDDEIALLQAERDKYLQIRSGMMDDLLTGKIRLQ